MEAVADAEVSLYTDVYGFVLHVEDMFAADVGFEIAWVMPLVCWHEVVV